MIVRPGDLVSVRRSFDRITHLRIRIVRPGWFIGHSPSGVCHRARYDDIISIVG